MIKVLVSLGTTRFDGLVEFFDYPSEKVEFFFQCPEDGLQPRHWPSTSFISDFENKVHEYDCVVSHAGAGNVYSLLEKKIKLCVVPNLERADKHQSELSEYLKANELAYVFYLPDDSYSQQDVLIENVIAFQGSEYNPQKFFKMNDILEYFS